MNNTEVTLTRTIRFPADEWERIALEVIKRRATGEKYSFNDWILEACREKLKEDKS